jgi:hypothetical protein
LVIKPLEEDSTPGTVKPFQVSLVEPVDYHIQLMAEDIAALARERCAEKKIFFVHFRDVEGTRGTSARPFTITASWTWRKCCASITNADSKVPCGPITRLLWMANPMTVPGGKVLAIG